MRARNYTTYPELRKRFSSVEELGQTINRSTWTINQIMAGKRNFTEIEKNLILRHLGEPDESKALIFRYWAR